MAIKMVECRWCGMMHGKMCPTVKSIEYFDTGCVKRVEFKCAGDYPDSYGPDMTWRLKSPVAA